jgi:pimeloyl-ACP methyl ester carboxylesterase
MTAELYREVHGTSGPHVLFVHGYLSSRAQWRLNIDALAGVARVVIVELWGHGRSPAPADVQAYTPASYVAEFERIREDLGEERWVICGQSLGAALTLRYALDHAARVAGHIFTNSTSALAEEGWGDLVRPAMEVQAQRFEAEGRGALRAHPLHPARATRIPEAVRDELVADCELHDLRGLALTGLHTVPGSSCRARIGENAVASLLVAGTREKRFADHLRFAEAHMPRLEIVRADAGHAVNIEAAEAFNEAAAAFIRRHAVGSP